MPVCHSVTRSARASLTALSTAVKNKVLWSPGALRIGHFSSVLLGMDESTDDSITNREHINAPDGPPCVTHVLIIFAPLNQSTWMSRVKQKHNNTLGRPAAGAALGGHQPLRTRVTDGVPAR